MDTVMFTIMLFSFFLSPRVTDATPEIITSLTDIVMGQEHLLLCKAGRDAEIEWQKDGEEADPDRYEVSGDETSSTLIVKNAELQDSGNYTCKCVYESSESEAFVRIYVYDPPNFGNTKLYHEFLVNQTAHIPCVVTGQPEVETNWYWKNARISSDGVSNIRVLTDGTLQITNIQKENHGTYTCEGRIKGRPVSRHLDISVVVNIPPTVRVRSERAHVLAGPNTSVTINCLVTGAPQPIITWTGPSTSDSSRYIYNSDKSKLTIQAVSMKDYGEYICTALNKIGEHSATIQLDISEQPTVILSQKKLVLKLGESASVLCNATGHPPPTLQWLMKSRHESLSSAGRLRVEGSKLIVEMVEPSDGGLFSCKATNAASNTTEDFSLITSPAVPTSFSVSPGPTSVLITIEAPVTDGGSPITQYIIQFRKQTQDEWRETVISFFDPLTVTSLEPYTEYFVRFAAQNEYFLGGFSEEKLITTLGKREPDTPVLSVDEGRIEKNSYSIPIKQLNDGSSPIAHYLVRYRLDQEDVAWTENEIDPSSHSIQLSDLKYNSDYQVEIFAVNLNGDSRPAKFSFSIPEAQKSLGRGGVVGIIVAIFLLLLVAVDFFCCYTNNCGLLNFLRQKLCGHKLSKSKSVEDGVINNAAVDMNGMEKPRGSLPKQQSQNGRTKEVQAEVICDKAPLTKFEKAQAKDNPVAET